MKLILVTIIATVFMVACKPNDNGQYVIYSVESTQYSNDTVANYLKNDLQGDKLDISFQDKYVSITSLKTKKVFLLAKEKVRNRFPTYFTAVTKQNFTTSFTLTQDTALSLSVSLSIMQPNRTYYDSAIGRVYNDKVGSVICSLSKVDDK
jgi:hypothetical protein